MSQSNRRVIPERFVLLLTLGSVGPVLDLKAGALSTRTSRGLGMSLQCAQVPHTFGINHGMKPLLDPQDLGAEPLLLLHHGLVQRLQMGSFVLNIGLIRVVPITSSVHHVRMLLYRRRLNRVNMPQRVRPSVLASFTRLCPGQKWTRLHRLVRAKYMHLHTSNNLE